MVNEKNKVITVKFTPINSGDHRVCYKVDGGTEICTTITNAQQGVVTEAQFPVTYSDPGIADANITGYVQPTCGGPTDAVSQATFNTLVTVDSLCNSYTLKCNEASIAAVRVVDGGTGYFTVPTLTIDDPTGTGATFTVNKDFAGRITDVVVNNAGSGYSNPTLNITGTVGTGANLELITTSCETSDTYTGCHGNIDTFPTANLGESKTICYNARGTAPVAPSGYTMTPGISCWTITQNVKVKNNHSILDLNSQLQIQFVDLTGAIVNVTLGASHENTYQVVSGSLAIMNINALADPTKVNISIV